MAGIFFNPDKLSPYSVADKAKGFRTDFSQNYEAAKNDFFARLRSDSQVSAFTELFSQNDQLIADLGGEINPNPLFLNHSDTIRVPEVEDMVKSMNDDLMERNDVYDFNDFINSYDAHMDWYFKEVDRLKASDPIKFKDVKTREQIDNEVIEKAREAWETNQEIKANAEPGLFGWNWGQLAGGMRAGITDPVVLGTLPLGVVTGGWSWSGTIGMQLLKTFAVEAILGGVAETVIQQDVYKYNNDVLDIKYTAKEAAAAIATVAVASGVLGDMILGMVRTGQFTKAQLDAYYIANNKGEWFGEQLGKMLDANDLDAAAIIKMSLDGLNRSNTIKIINNLPDEFKTPEIKAILENETNKQFDMDNNPFENTVNNALEHEKRIQQGTENLILENVPDVERPLIPLDEGLKDYSNNKIEFKIDELETDAKVFQYKQGGDAFGVTERLQGVTEWNPHAANVIIAYEFLDGRKVVADGHQRLGLAKRIKAQNDGQDVRLFGYLYREADGYSPEQIKVWAAIKNIQEGSGTATDAAKILRTSKKEFDNFKKALPPRSVMVREALAMESLADDAFDLVARGQAESSHAALVAQLVKDKNLHLPILQLLNKTNPENLNKARTIVLQALESKFDTTEQLDLLGSEFITSSLVTNKADILDAVIKGLKRDKFLFKGLNQNKTKINSSGKNVLDENYNQNQELINEKILQLIESKALRKGEPLAEELNNASVIHAKGNERAAIEQFRDAIKRANERGDFDGYDASRSGNDSQSPDTSTKFLEEKDLTPTIQEEKFDTPAGAGQVEQGNFLQDQLSEVLDIKPKAERGEFSVDEILQNTDPIDRKIVYPILNKIDPDILNEALTNINKARKKSKLPPFKNLDDAIDQYEADQLALNKLDTTESIINTPQRESLRLNITNILQKHHGHTTAKDKLFKGQPKAEKKVVFVMGKPGSGKSSIEAVPLVKKLKAVLIDSDEAKKLFPEFDNGKGAGIIHEESSIVATELTRRALQNDHNMVIPIVGADADSVLKKINGFKENGYKVYLHNVDIPGDESYRRAFVRYLNTGRLIDHGYLINVGNKPNEVYNYIKSLNILDGYKKTDNFVKRGEKPLLIEEEGGISLGEKFSKSDGKNVARRGGEEKTTAAEVEKRLNRVELILDKQKELDNLRAERLKINETPIGSLVFKPELQQKAVDLDKQITKLSDEISDLEKEIPSNKTPVLSEQQQVMNEFIDEDFSISSKLENDEVVPELVTAKQIMEDIDNDQAIINRLKDCVA